MRFVVNKLLIYLVNKVLLTVLPGRMLVKHRVH